jgi:peroxiredoxin
VEAPDVEVQLSSGQSVPLSSLYGERPLVLVFLRHFGCTFCKEQVANLRVHLNLNVAFVSMASPQQAEEFRLKMGSPHPFICDTRQELYQAFGLGRGSGKQMFNPKVFVRGFGATLRGHFVGLPIGDPWQMPGVFKIETDGKVSWEYRSMDASDNPSNDQVLKVLDSE